MTRCAASPSSPPRCVAGCPSTPTAPPALDLPPATRARVPVDLERWWTAFDDPVLTRWSTRRSRTTSTSPPRSRASSSRARKCCSRSRTSIPSVNLQAATAAAASARVGSPPLPSGVDPLSNNYRVGVQASYELDVWGKYRTATQAARQTLLATRVLPRDRAHGRGGRRRAAPTSACSPPTPSSPCCATR